MIWGAAWALSRPNELFTGSGDDPAVMQSGVAEPEGCVLREITGDVDTLELRLRFDGELRLQVVPITTDLKHWLVYLHNDTVLEAGPGRLLRSGSRRTGS